MSEHAPWQVTQLNNYLKNRFDTDPVLRFITLEGEISGLVNHSSGHSYFSLKDASSAIRCVFFKGYKSGLKFKPENGQKVVAVGSVSVFPRDGSYQLYVTSLFQSGIGLESLKLQELKEKLQNEGLFDTKNKKELPSYPMRIGVVTSPTGAAIQDIKSVIRRRFPLCSLLLYPATVQGANAAASLKYGVETLDSLNLDIILLTRGGGSSEDLNAFNDESLARAVFAANTPIVAAVGHEIDYSLVDLVADVRAATPTAAAEISVPDQSELKNNLLYLENQLFDKLYGKASGYKETLSNSLKLLELKFDRKAEIARSYLSHSAELFNERIEGRLDLSAQFLKAQIEKLNALNPLNTLLRGYSAIKNENGIADSVDSFTENQKIEILLRDGTVKGTLSDIKKEKKCK